MYFYAKLEETKCLLIHLYWFIHLFDLSVALLFDEIEFPVVNQWPLVNSWLPMIEDHKVVIKKFLDTWAYFN